MFFDPNIWIEWSRSFMSFLVFGFSVLQFLSFQLFVLGFPSCQFYKFRFFEFEARGAVPVYFNGADSFSRLKN